MVFKIIFLKRVFFQISYRRTEYSNCFFVADSIFLDPLLHFPYALLTVILTHLHCSIEIKESDLALFVAISILQFKLSVNQATSEVQINPFNSLKVSKPLSKTPCIWNYHAFQLVTIYFSFPRLHLFVSTGSKKCIWECQLMINTAASCQMMHGRSP